MAFSDEQDEAEEIAVSDVVRLPENVPSLAAEIAVERVPEKRSGSGSGQKRSGSGLPALKHIQWEQRADRPGFEGWHAPQGSNAPRNTKIYLGYVGKKLLADWLAMRADERAAVVSRWIAERRIEKGL